MTSEESSISNVALSIILWDSKEMSNMEVLKELKEIVNPAHTALIIMDTQHDFISSQGFWGSRGFDMSRIQAAVPRLNNFIEQCRNVGVLVV